LFPIGKSTKESPVQLTRQQQKLLVSVVLLLLTGLAVKSWRTANPPQSGANAAGQIN